MDRQGLGELVEALGLSADVVADRLRALGMRPDDRARLRAALPEVRANAPRFIDAFYDELGRCPSTRTWLVNDDVVRRLKKQQVGYLTRLFGDDLDWEHVLYCLHIGVVHHRVRLTPQWFVASYGHFVCQHLPILMQGAPSREEGIERVVVLLKSVLFDASIVLDAYAMSAENALRAERVVPNRPHAAHASASTSSPAAAAAPAVARSRLAFDEASDRASFLGIDDAVRAELATLAPAVDAVLPEMLEEFYALFSEWPATRDLVPAPAVDRLKASVASYWRELCRGTFDRSYAASRSLVGVVHERIGLSAPHYAIGLAHQVARLVRVAATVSDRATDALLRAVFYDLSFVLQAYVEAHAEAVLRTEGFAADLLAGMTSAVVMVDARMRVESANPALLTMFGLDARLVRWVRLGDVLPIPELVDLARQVWRDGPRLSRVVRTETRTFRATGLRLTTHAGRESVALVVDELTDVVHLHAEVRQNERSYAQVLDVVRALVWEADDADGFTLTLVSRASADLLGRRDVTLLGRRDALLESIPEPDRTAFVARCARLAPGERAEVRHRLLHADGSTRHARTSVARLLDPSARPILVGVTVDVTASHLEDQARLEAVATLAGGAAHEYNNRLTVILTGLALLGETPLDVSMQDLVRVARQSAEDCATLTKQLLGFAQRQTLRPAPLVPNDLIGAAQPMLRGLLGASVELELRLAPNVGRCSVDEKELMSSLLNVVSNAKESMPTGGRLTIATRNVSANDADDVRDLVEIAIEDTGVGMDDGVRRRAFEPFFTTKPAARGLGLSAVRGFVAQSGGRVHLDPRVGGGTVVRLLFPRVDDASAVPVEDATRPMVLAVDDEPTLRHVLRHVIKRLGYAVTVVGTVAEALAVLRAQRVDVLVTDVVLSRGETGTGLVAEARVLRPDLPVVYISGFTRDELELTALGSREWFLAKPFDLDELQRVLNLAAPVEATAKGA